MFLKQLVVFLLGLILVANAQTIVRERTIIWDKADLEKQDAEGFEKDGAAVIEIKNNETITCGSLKKEWNLIKTGEVAMLQPTKSDQCAWKFKTSSRFATLIFTCKFISLFGQSWKNCAGGEYLEVDNNENLKRRYCGIHRNVEFDSYSNRLVVILHSMGYSGGYGSFELQECQVFAKNGNEEEEKY